MNILDLLNEEMYGNTATVYHRTNIPETAEYILKGQWKNGKMGTYYGKGVYTVYDPKTTFDAASKETGRINKKNIYGGLVFKLRVKDTSNFLIFNYDVYKKLNPRTTSIDKPGATNPAELRRDKNNNSVSFIDEQREKFGIKSNINDQYDFVNHNDAAYETGYTSEIPKFVNESGFEDVRKKVAGIIYHGKGDGPTCLLAFRPSSLVPISYTDDEGKTWKKIESSPEYRKNASKENSKDYYNDKAKEEDIKDSMKNHTGKEIKIVDSKVSHMKTLHGVINRDLAIHDSNVLELKDVTQVNGKLEIKNCYNLRTLFTIPPAKELYIYNCPITSLEGLAGKKYNSIHIEDCYNLITLKGSPKKIENFEIVGCSQLKSLKGGPEIVTGDYLYRSNNVKSIKGCPKIIRGTFDILHASGLTQLEPAFMPKYVGETIYFPAQFSKEAVEDYMRHKGKKSNKAFYTYYNGHRPAWLDDDEDYEPNIPRSRVGEKDSRGKIITKNKDIDPSREKYDYGERNSINSRLYSDREEKRSSSYMGFKNTKEQYAFEQEMRTARSKMIKIVNTECASKLSGLNIKINDFWFDRINSLYPSECNFSINGERFSLSYTMLGHSSNAKRAEDAEVSKEDETKPNPANTEEVINKAKKVVEDIIYNFYPKRFIKENRGLLQRMRAANPSEEPQYKGRNNTIVKSRFNSRSLYESLGL